MAECIADVDCSLEMAKDRLLAEMAKGITPTNQLNGPQNRAEFHAGMYIPRRGDRVVLRGSEFTVTRIRRFNGKPQLTLEENNGGKGA